MGTNYYLIKTLKHEGACDHCPEGDVQRIHLGKSSIGWKFLFYADPAWGQEYALSQWLQQVEGADHIESQYGRSIELADLLALVMMKQGDRCALVNDGRDISGPGYAVGSRYHNCGFDFDSREFS